jgi:hypothetical protein
MNKLCINAAKLECSFNGEMKENRRRGPKERKRFILIPK